MKKFLSLLLMLSVPVLAMDQPQSTVVTVDEEEQDVQAVTATIDVLKVNEDATPDTDENTTTEEDGEEEASANDARLPIEKDTSDKSIEEVVEVRTVSPDKE